MRVYLNYYKKFHNYIKKNFIPQIYIFFCLLNIRMLNLSFDELRLIAQIRNITSYENKSKEDLIKALSESKQTPKPKPKPEPEPKIRVKTNKRKLKKLRKYFDELRHKLSKKK